jgi:hypothetical protein
MTTPEELGRRHTLLTAAARHNELTLRDTLAPPNDEDENWGSLIGLDQQEALELLALSELLARKAVQGRQLAVRTARATGASWAQIGAALGTSKQAAWESHLRWLDEQVGQQPDALPGDEEAS